MYLVGDVVHIQRSHPDKRYRFAVVDVIDVRPGAVKAEFRCAVDNKIQFDWIPTEHVKPYHEDVVAR